MAANTFQNHAQNVYLILVLATVLGTLAGTRFVANAQTGLVWLFLVGSASCGISSVVALALLPMMDGFHLLTVFDVVLALFVAISAVRTWAWTLNQVEIA
ncbi:hypothetical protein HAP94_06510 [Acidithiobacillus ferrivorans]|nr:hypothetical protein [Acidithiobacillus ferrivorans]